MRRPNPDRPEHDLIERMTEAARRATEEAMARGYSRSHPVTMASAKQAAEEVRLAEMSAQGHPAPGPAPVDDQWERRSDLD